VIQIPDKQRIKLTPVAGLETAWGAAGVFDAPRSEVGMLGDGLQLLRIRRVGEKEEAQIKMQPRVVKAEISFWPKNPRWPGDPVTVTLRLVDRDGVAQGGIEIRPVVHLNLESLPVSWQKDATVWRTVIAARSNGRPHVLRIEVQDQFGYQLGKGFLEIAHHAEAKTSGMP